MIHSSPPDARPRALVLRPGALGDTVLTYPALAALRRSLPDHAIVAFGHRETLALVCPAYVDCARSFDDPALTALFGPDDSLPLDPILGLGPVETAVIWLAGPVDGIVARLRSLGLQRWIAIDPRPPEGRPQHVADHLLRGLSGLTPLDLDLLPCLPLSREQRQQGRVVLHHLVGRGRGPVIALHPGSGGPRKCWPAEGFADLADRLRSGLNARVILLCGPADRVVVEQVRRLGRGERPAVVEGMPLASLASLLSQVDAVVGNDSGISHLAAAAGAPVVALYGPTDPAIWGVRGPRVIHRRAPSARLADISTGDVLDALAVLLAPNSHRHDRA